MKVNYIILFILGLAFISGNCKKENQNTADPLSFTDQEIQLIKSNSQDTMLRVLNLFVYNDSLILRKISRNVSFTDTVTLYYLKSRMYRSVINPLNTGVGIAAPQVGINRRICWVQRWDKGSRYHPYEIYYNIRITGLSDTLKSRSDGCLSIPGVSANSLRALWVGIEYQKPDGSFVQEKIVHEYTAHIFQHEIDHLDGIVFLDRLAKMQSKKFVIIDR